MSYSTKELWVLMFESDDNEVSKAADDIEFAYNWIINHPQLYVTSGSIVIESDWAEIGLLTPSATIQPDPNIPVPDPTNTVFQTTKILWGREHSHDQRRMTIKYVLRYIAYFPLLTCMSSFRIINDGSPLDIYISHGSDGGNLWLLFSASEYLLRWSLRDRFLGSRHSHCYY